MPVFRIVSWEFLTKPDQWHAFRSAHAHLGCSIIGKWKSGGCAKHHARYGRGGPPEPPSVSVEYHVPTDIPPWLRCAYCWGKARDRNVVPGPRWHPHWDEPWWPYTIEWPKYWKTYPRGACDKVRDWCTEQFNLTQLVWRRQYGGIYEREVVVLTAPPSTIIVP
jgi:hypothetical protein